MLPFSPSVMFATGWFLMSQAIDDSKLLLSAADWAAFWVFGVFFSKSAAVLLVPCLLSWYNCLIWPDRKSLALLNISPCRLPSLISFAFWLENKTSCSNKITKSQNGVASYSDLEWTFLAVGDVFASFVASIRSSAKEVITSLVRPWALVIRDWRKEGSLGSKCCRKASHSSQ